MQQILTASKFKQIILSLEIVKTNNSLNSYAHLNTFVQSYDIASKALNNFKKIHYMY